MRRLLYLHPSYEHVLLVEEIPADLKAERFNAKQIDVSSFHFQYMKEDFICK